VRLSGATRTGYHVDSSPAIGSDGTVYVGSGDHNVYALNGATGALLWNYATGDKVSSSRAIGSDGTVYIGSWDNKVYALNGATGSLVWSFTTGGLSRQLPVDQVRRHCVCRQQRLQSVCSEAPAFESCARRSST